MIKRIDSHIPEDIPEDKAITAYKIAVKDKWIGLYYSSAVGVHYKINGEITNVKIQNRLSSYYNDSLLTNFDYKLRTNSELGGFRSYYVGKTGAYLNIMKAKSYFYSLGEHPVAEGYSLVLLEVQIYGDVLYSTNKGYTFDNAVLGSCMKIIKEIDILEQEKFITAEYLQNNTNVIFVFGDNTQRIGSGGAAILRYEPNTYGFITKKFPDYEDSSFYTVEEYREVFSKELQLLIDKIENEPDKTFLISKIGAGLANRYNIFEEVIYPQLKEALCYYDNVEFLW